MAAIFNFLWAITYGWILALGWTAAAALAAVTVVLLPFSRACLRMAGLAIWPFGRELVAESDVSLKDSVLKSGWRGLLNIGWFLTIGGLMALSHAFAAFTLFVLCLPIVTAPIFLPMALVNLKLAGAALFPVGKRVVSKDEAKYVRESAARLKVEQRREGARGRTKSRAEVHEAKEGYVAAPQVAAPAPTPSAMDAGPPPASRALLDRIAAALTEQGWEPEVHAREADEGSDIVATKGRLVATVLCLDGSPNSKSVAAALSAKSNLAAHLSVMVCAATPSKIVAELAARSRVTVCEASALADLTAQLRDDLAKRKAIAAAKKGTAA